MTAPAITDHALLRFLERAGGLDVEGLRLALGTSLTRAHAAARSVSSADYLIKADGMVYVVRGENVTTVLDNKSAAGLAASLVQGHL